MGIIYRKQGDFSKAYEYNLNSLEIKEELGDKRGISNCLNNTGIIYEEQGDYPKALEYFQKSLKIKQEIGDKNGISASFLNIGTAYLKTYQYAKALDYTQKALEIAIEIEHLDRLKDIHEQLSKIYAATNNYRKAYEHYVEYKQLNDSIFNEENIKRITALEYQYKYEKEKELAAAEQAEKDALQAAEAKRQQIIRNAFIGAFVLMLLIAGLIYLNLNQKRKLNRILTQQKHKVEEENVELEQQKEEIQIENYKAQLKVLQSQVDPHFLFNAFNTLRTMVRNQHTNAEKYVMSLSDLYRQALMHHDENIVPLSKELDVLKSYLFLMKSRNENAVLVDIDIDEHLFEHHLPTMALQIVVENCFKHNSMSSKKPLNIDITSTEDSYIEVCNNLQPKIGEVKSSGHGLEILKKKYELLNIQDGLLIEKTPGEFCVKLKLIKT
jgi:tetratricopeptide (TPR) repeat protein